jgi:hypothetical protein
VYRGKANRNTNGTYDYGPMQINTVSLNDLARFGYSIDEIKNNPCTNVWVGTWILSEKIKKSKNFWRGIGNYNSKNFPQNTNYQFKVAKVYYS